MARVDMRADGVTEEDEGTGEYGNGPSIIATTNGTRQR